MSKVYLETNVFEESKKRIEFIFDDCDDVIVGMSGGKDSTVCYNLALEEARKRGRLPLKVYWIDQEAEWQATDLYMKSIMHNPEVNPFWFQIPFNFTNSLSFRDNFLRVWEEGKEDIWIRPQDPISIKVNPTKCERFYELAKELPTCCDVEGKKNVGLIIGVRMQESTARQLMIGYTGKAYKGITWCKKPYKNVKTFYPIYDYTTQDIWTAIAQNNWDYNKIYDHFYRYGVSNRNMRVSALIHETAWYSIEPLQEVEPHMYNRYVQRVSGVNTFSHFQKDIVPKDLPPYFINWKEYRDYLLVNLTDPKYHELFLKRWANQTTEEWYKYHVREIMINDIDGTTNDNSKIRITGNKRRKENWFTNKWQDEFSSYMDGRENENEVLD